MVQVPGEAMISFYRLNPKWVMVGSSSAIRGRKRGFQIFIDPQGRGTYEPSQELIQRIESRVQAEYAPVAFQAIEAYDKDKDEFRRLNREATYLLAKIARDVEKEINSE